MSVYLKQTVSFFPETARLALEASTMLVVGGRRSELQITPWWKLRAMRRYLVMNVIIVDSIDQTGAKMGPLAARFMVAVWV